MSRRSPHLEVIWPGTAECSLMRKQTLHNNKNKQKKSNKQEQSGSILK